MLQLWELFHRETEIFKSIFKNNNYPQNFMNHCIKTLFKKLLIQRDLNFIISKRGLTCVLPYLGRTSLDLKT